MNINKKIDAKIFKAYDIRGIYPDEINEEIVSEIIAAVVKNFKPKKIIIGHDARLSSPKLYQALIKQFKILNLKFKIIPTGLITTPMLYFLTNYSNADLGIMITASHNPKQYNGLKIVGKNAVPISGKQIWKIIS
ncbi:MAG: hypothetical protein M1170_02940 [Patescibacteria group bacterium]|nr:hypothetical protein [Patescibacteria group bacterium]